MCGRYTLRRANRVKAIFDAAITPTFEEFSQHGPRFNIAPTQLVPVVRLNREGKRALSSISWGLIPSWTKATPKIKPINARAETILSSNMYKAAMQRRRCLVPADGFGSTALVSQNKLLADAGSNVFSWNFVDLYGTNQDQLVVWNSFLDGKLDVAGLTSGLQKITDAVYNDSSVTKVVVK